MSTRALLPNPQVTPSNRSQRLQRWFLDRVRQRRGQLSLPYTLAYRLIYIVPTRFGAGFGVMLALTALGALNFNNNLALLLIFTLGAVAQSTTLLAYRNLAGLEITQLRADPVFAGEALELQLLLTNPEDRERFSLVLLKPGGQHSDCIDIGAEASGQLRLHTRAIHRGWQKLPALCLETRYPLGLFRAWTWIFPAEKALVYPQPAIQPPPLPASGEGHSGAPHKGEGDQVHGLRNYQPGDSLRRVAWRTSARHQNLYTREMETPREQSCELDWNLLKGSDIESRLSILTAWVIQAEHRSLRYSLQLPGVHVAKGHGPEHRDRCLEALATYGG